MGLLVPLSKVKKDIDYALIITTNSGLWRYLIGDTIRFTSLDPYRIKITGRTRHYINVFGEEVNIENAEDALKLACKKTNATIIDYTVGPIFMKGKKSGGHEWVIEFNKAPENMNYFTELLDNALKSINSDYEAKRYNSLTLAMPIIHLAKKGLFYRVLCFAMASQAIRGALACQSRPDAGNSPLPQQWLRAGR